MNRKSTAAAALAALADPTRRQLIERLGENAAAVRDMLTSGWGGLLESYVASAHSH